MRRGASCITACLAISALTLGGSQRARAESPVTIVDLGTMVPQGINNSDRIAGYTANNRAALWQDGQITHLGSLPGGSVSAANGINESGEIAGTSGVNGDQNTHAFVWQSGSMTDLGTLGGTTSFGEGINDAGAAVGSSYLADNVTIHAFQWTGALTDLAPNLGPVSDASAINDAGQAVGFANNQAYLYQGGNTQNLGTLGGAYSRAFAINGSGTVAGESATPTPNQTVHAFLWSNGVMSDLGALRSAQNDSHALAINERDEVVGYSSVPDNGQNIPHAFLWFRGFMIDLNAQVLGHPDWIFNVATGINRRGDIIGYGTLDGQQHGFLLRMGWPSA